MKKIFKNSRLIAIAFFTVFTASLAPAAFANDSNELPVELKYIGNINNQSIFQLKVNGNLKNSEFTISINDPFGNPVYRENIKGENFTKKFLFNTEELGDDTLDFTIFCRTSNKTVLYKINRQTRFIEEMVVSEQK